MLIELDAQARYVAATLTVLDSELRKIALPTEARCSILGLLERAQERAEHLADALCIADTTHASPRLPRPGVRTNSPTSNVVPFARRA